MVTFAYVSEFEDVCVRLCLLLVAASWAHQPRNLQAKAFPPVVSEPLEGFKKETQVQRREISLRILRSPNFRQFQNVRDTQKAASRTDT